MRANVGEFGASEDEVDSEIGDLMEILSVVGARKQI
jgi:hypothetical protein